MNLTTCAALIEALNHYALQADAHQIEQSHTIINFIESSEAPWRRSTIAGHLTASAWIIDDTWEEVLLLHHKKLDRWLQPGGHIDDSDASVFDAALREAAEETGLTGLGARRLAQGAVFDVDVHPIPARSLEPEHFHYDIRYAFSVQRNAIVSRNEAEANAMRWFSLNEVASSSSFDPSIKRMALRSITRALTTP